MLPLPVPSGGNASPVNRPQPILTKQQDALEALHDTELDAISLQAPRTESKAAVIE